MGHLYLGNLPKTYRWKHVIQLLDENRSVAEIAEASFWAAQNGFKKIPDDVGFTLTLTNIFKFIEMSADLKKLLVLLFEYYQRDFAEKIRLEKVENKLPNDFRCVHCSAEICLELDERVSKVFICPTCFKENDCN